MAFFAVLFGEEEGEKEMVDGYRRLGRETREEEKREEGRERKREEKKREEVKK